MKSDKVKQLEAEVARLREELREALLEVEQKALAERLRQVNKAAGFPDNTMGVP